MTSVHLCEYIRQISGPVTTYGCIHLHILAHLAIPVHLFMNLYTCEYSHVFTSLYTLPYKFFTCLRGYIKMEYIVLKMRHKYIWHTCTCSTLDRGCMWLLCFSSHGGLEYLSLLTFTRQHLSICICIFTFPRHAYQHVISIRPITWRHSHWKLGVGGVEHLPPGLYHEFLCQTANVLSHGTIAQVNSLYSPGRRCSAPLSIMSSGLSRRYQVQKTVFRMALAM